MSVSARTNAFGDHSYFKTIDKVYKRTLNGVLVQDSPSQEVLIEHHCLRNGATAAPRVLPNSTTVWRDPTPYTRGVATWSRGSALWSQTWENWGDVWTEQYTATGLTYGPYPEDQVPASAFYFPGPYASWSDDLESEAIAKAIAKIKDKKAALGEAIKEARQTAATLEEEGKRLVNALLAVKRGNIRGAIAWLKGDARSVVRRGADLLLQYKYGWKPLMSDIKGSWDLLSEQLNNPALIISASAKSRLESIHSRSDASVNGSRQVQCKLYGRVNSDVYRFIDRIGLSDPVTMAWEFIPWSFVVDWFAPVGPALNTLIAPAGVEWLGGCSTLRGECSVSRTIQPRFPLIGDPVVDAVKGFSVTRKVYYDWPVAGLYTVNPFTLSHGESALALLYQKLFR